MSVDNRLMVKTLQGLREFYTVVSKATRMHFVECDPETFDDQAYIFTEKQDADSFAAVLAEKNYPASAERIGRNKIGSFYTGLYLTGVNRIVFRNGAGTFYMPLSSVVTMKRPDEDEKVPPRMNDTLQLSSIYFLQELRRPNQSKDDTERAGRLRELEQEMLANLMRSRFILAFDASAVIDGADQNEMSKELKVLYLKTSNGDILQPIFSDMWEFQKFSTKNSGKYRLAAVPFKALSGSLIKSARGYVLNPADINMLLPRERLTALSSQQVYEIKFTE